MKKLSLPSLTKKAVRIFNRYVRLKYTDRQTGLCMCVTCNIMKPFSEIEAGHYIKSTYAYTRFDELNVHPQCVRCNKFLNGNESKYALFLTRTYGPHILEVLEEKRTRLAMSSMQRRSQLEAIIDVYSTKLRELDTI